MIIYYILIGLNILSQYLVLLSFYSGNGKLETNSLRWSSYNFYLQQFNKILVLITEDIEKY